MIRLSRTHLLMIVAIAAGLLAFSSSAVDDGEVNSAGQFNLVYLTDRSQALDEIGVLLAHLNGTALHAADELAMYLKLFTIDAIWLDAAGLEYADSAFLRELYTHGVPITVFNIEAGALAALLGDDGLEDRYVLVANEIVYASVQQMRLRNDADPIVPLGASLEGSLGVRSFSGSRVGMLSREDERAVLLWGVANDLAQVRDFKRQFFAQAIAAHD